MTGAPSPTRPGQRHWQGWLRGAALAAITILFFLPLAWTGLAAFQLRPNNSTWPPAWTWPPSLNSYAEVGVAEPAFYQELATSAGLSAGATALTMGISFLAAYSLARSPLRHQRAFAQSALVLASLPVMAYVIPLSETMRGLHLLDSYVGVLLPQTAVFAPLAVYILYGYLAQLSREFEEAARLDGAGTMDIIARIVLPMLSPGLAATAIIILVLNWNLLLIPLVLTAGHVKTLPVAMSDFFTFERELEWPTAAAALVVSLLPLLALVGLAHRLLDRFSLDAATVPD